MLRLSYRRCGQKILQTQQSQQFALRSFASESQSSKGTSSSKPKWRGYAKGGMAGASLLLGGILFNRTKESEDVSNAAMSNGGYMFLPNPVRKLITDDTRVDGCTTGMKPVVPVEVEGQNVHTDTGLVPAYYPVMSLDFVRKSAERENAPIWVTFEGSVYDVTEFIDQHPGGPGRIEMMAGTDLGSAWEIYDFHSQRQHVLDLLEMYKIGILSPEDAKKSREESPLGDYYDAEQDLPARDAEKRKEFRIPSTRPWNSEPITPKALIDNFYTPNDQFFIRNHNSVPMIEEEDFELEIAKNEEIGIKESKTFTLEDLKKLPHVEVRSVIQCAGNRQEDFVGKGRPLYVAPHWTNHAIGNAVWVGVRVRDVLGLCGVDVDGIALGKVDLQTARWINFVGEDADETGVPYASSLPMEKICDGVGDCILAFEMNGETIPHDHGYPIRLVAPGHAGCRNTKWVSHIEISAGASSLDSGSKLDRHFAPNVSFIKHLRHGDEHVRLDQGPVLQTLPVTSIICEPQKDTEVEISADQQSVVVKGVAWSGGGRGVSRVEVSVDGGQKFSAAEINRGPKRGRELKDSRMGTHWEWVHFEQTLPLSEQMKKDLQRKGKIDLHIVSRAIDGDFNTQPETMEQCWNVLGICANHWSRVDAKGKLAK